MARTRAAPSSPERFGAPAGGHPWVVAHAAAGSKRFELIGYVRARRRSQRRPRVMAAGRMKS